MKRTAVDMHSHEPQLPFNCKKCKKCKMKKAVKVICDLCGQQINRQQQTRGRMWRGRREVVWLQITALPFD